MNYIIRGLNDMKYAVGIGTLIYGVIFLFLFLLKRRKRLSWKCAAELCFCVYSIWLLQLVGIPTLKFSVEAVHSYDLIPFLGSSIIPEILNFLMFIPYGILLPIVFPSIKNNWKKMMLIGASTSLIIEILQLFGGRLFESEDVILNTMGAVTGYALVLCIRKWKKDRKKAMQTLFGTILILLIFFGLIFLIGNNEEDQPDGFFAVEDNIVQVSIYVDGQSKEIDANTDVFNTFFSQVSNCGGHIMKADEQLPDELVNGTDCFIEIIFDGPQNISFESVDGFAIMDADRVLYNANKNILYWGNSTYKYRVDYTEMDAQLIEHKSEILEQYQELAKEIQEQFETK